MTNTINEDIRELNLSYLLVAQRILREDEVAGAARMGIDPDTAEILKKLTLAQVTALAHSHSVICSFRLNDAQLLTSLTKQPFRSSLQQARATLALTQQMIPQEAAVSA